MSAKPADYFVGLHDFFALLVPGAVLTFWALSRRPDSGRGLLPAEIGSGSAALWIGFLLASFFVGQVLYSVAALLDGLGDRLASRSVEKHEATFQEWLKKFPDERKLRYVGMAWLRVNCPNAMPEVDRLMALSKFYRSLTIVFLVVMVFPDDIMWSAAILMGISFGAYVYHRSRHRKAIVLYLTIAGARGSNG